MVILPLIIGIVIGVGCFAYVSHSQTKLLPLANNITFAYHDRLDDAGDKVAGEPVFEDGSIQIEYGVSYSSLGDKLCMCEESDDFGELGTVYFKTSAKMSKQIPVSFSINTKTGEHKYKLMYELDGKNEYELLHYSTGAKKGLLIYWQESNSVGLSNTFGAMVFEEVE